jgi:hypothetical protein
MCVPLSYSSCLFEDALDLAVSDFLETQRNREEQEKAKQEYEEEVERERVEKERVGEIYEQEAREWEQITEKQFETVMQNYVVCLDTLG